MIGRYSYVDAELLSRRIRCNVTGVTRLSKDTEPMGDNESTETEESRSPFIQYLACNSSSR